MNAQTKMLALALLTCIAASAQIIKFIPWSTPKETPVTINHPATLGLALTGKTVAFNPSSRDACAQQFVDALTQDFESHGVNVVDRDHLAAILKEQGLQSSDLVDAHTAVQIGKISGAAYMVTVNLTRCYAERSPPLQNSGTSFTGQSVVTRISRTTAHVQGAIHTVDLVTALDTTRQVQSDPQKQNQSQGGYLPPEYPSNEEVQDLAVRKAVAEASHLYFPWVETREVIFLDSKDCNLKQAYTILKTGDLAGALKASEDNVQECRSDGKPKHLADALYNLGIAYFLSREYDKALDQLKQAYTIHADQSFMVAINDVREAKAEEQLSIKRVNPEPKNQAAPSPQEGPEARPEARNAMTNADVIKVVRSHAMSDDLLIMMIKNKPAKFDTSTDAIIALKKAGVSDRVVAAMFAKQ